MKRLALVFLPFIFILSLVSCRIGGSGSTDGTAEPETQAPVFRVLYDTKSEQADRLAMHLYSLSGELPQVGLFSDYAKDGNSVELLLGRTDRAASEVAYRRLERLERDEPDLVGYVVYSSGNSIAVAYDEDDYGFHGALSVAAEQIMSELIVSGEETKFLRGVLFSEVFNIIDYKEAEEDEKKALEWEQSVAALRTVTENADAIAEAIKYYYDTVCSDEVISWFANLYDPVTGGFYYSNSARNTKGFLPDAESTSQALNFLKSSGMTDDVDRKLADAIPEWMKKQVIAFLKGLQDPDTGYFYHPQWSVESVNANVSRRSRDMNQATSILEQLGSAPTYDAPNGAIGDGILPDGTKLSKSTASGLTAPLGAPRASAVSKVILAAKPSVAAHLVSDVTFKEYLANLLEKNRLPQTDSAYRSFYSIGNTLSAQLTEIKNRDEQLKAEGARYSLGAILVEWLAENQNKKTGLWDEGINFAATNALTKIVYDFTTFGYVFPNADLAVESCIQMLFSDEEATRIVYVYNLWYSLHRILENLESYGKTAADIALCKRTRERLYELAPEAIRASADKQLRFKKDDGSISYTPTASASTSQGLSVAVPNSNEGDVNATTIGTFNTINEAISALGLSGKVPRCFTPADRMRFVSILNRLGAIIKDEGERAVTYYDFDLDIRDNPPEGGIVGNMKKGKLLVVPDGREGSVGNALQFTTVGGYYETVKIPNPSGDEGATCFVFESDFCVNSADEGNAFQLILQPYVYMLSFKIQDGRVHLIENSSTTWANSKETDLCTSVPLGEWFNLKIEYFVEDAASVRIVVYFNGKPVAVTDNYMDQAGDKLNGSSTPSDKYTHALLVGVTKYSFDILLDNTAVYSNKNTYSPIPSTENPPSINVDPPERDRLVYGFDGGTVPEELVIREGDAPPALVPYGEGGALQMYGVGNKKTPASVLVPINLRGKDANCVSFGARLKIDAAARSTPLRIYFRAPGGDAPPTVCFDLSVYNSGKGLAVGIFEAKDGASGALIESTALPLGEEFYLKIDFFEKEGVSLIYANEVLVGMSDALCKNAEKFSTGTLELTAIAGASYTVTLDELVFERRQASLARDSAPTVDELVYRFDDGEISPEGGAYISEGTLALTNVGAFARFPVTDRCDTVSYTRVRAVLDGVRGNQGACRFILSDQASTPIVAFDLLLSGGSATLREYYAGGAGRCVSSVSIPERVEVEFRYYFTRGRLCVFIGGECVGNISLTYTRENEALRPSYLTVLKSEGGAAVYIDELSAEGLLGIYSEEEPKGLITPEENGFDFENAFPGMLPEGGKYAEVTKAADISVKGVNTGSGYSKFLSIKTVSGGNDYVTFYAPEAADSEKVFVFEADVIFDGSPISATTSFQIQLLTEDGSLAWRPVFSFTDGKDVVATDYKNPSQSINCSIAKEGELFRLRIEYTLTDSGITVNLFSNGKYIATSTVHYSDTPIAAEDIFAIRFYATASTTAEVLLDNVSLTRKDTLTPTDGTDDEGDGETGDTSADALGGDLPFFDEAGWTEE